jgi:hypothetical protein
MESNPYEKKYKQLQMLGKGNYGTHSETKARSTRYASTTANKAKTLPISWPRRCSSRDSQKKTSNLPMEKYLTYEPDQNPGAPQPRIPQEQCPLPGGL